MNHVSNAAASDIAGYTSTEQYLQNEFARLNQWLASIDQPMPDDNESSILVSADRIYPNIFRSRAHEVEPSLIRFLRPFSTSRRMLDFFFFCIAPAINEKYLAAYAAVSPQGNSDVTPALLAHVFGDKGADWTQFCFGKNRFFERDILYWDPAGIYNESELIRPIRVHRRTLAFINGCQGIDTDAELFLKFEDSSVSLKTPKDRELENNSEELSNLIKYLNTESGSSLIFFEGPEGAGQSEAARRLSHEIDRPLIRVDLNYLLGQSETIGDAFRHIRREATLYDAILLVPDWEIVQSQSVLNHDFLLKNFQAASDVVIVTSEKPFPLSRKLYEVIHLEFSATSQKNRVESWERHWKKQVVEGSEINFEAIAGLYKFNEGQIRTISERVKLRARALHPNRPITSDDIALGCREESSQNLGALATKVNTAQSWEFLILPDKQKSQLRDLCHHMQFRGQVYEEWGYESQVAAVGLNVLFTGPPGTGKTLAASIIAHELGLELFKIDLSSIVSKYIGETEKNLSRIFEAAETSNSILFFDEADSLFGKRSEVRDAHDRYANIQVGYLLQKMEEFPGMTILATNLLENIDAAFSRRLHFVVDFPFPGSEEREKIWRKSFPGSAPVAGDVDFAALGKKLKIPGGNIRNIALHAAFFAAANGSTINMQQIVKAARNEFEKEGRPGDGLSGFEE